MDTNPLYESLEADLAPLKETLASAANVIVDQDVSFFPIFVLCQEVVDIGINIVGRGVAGSSWLVNASTLEEFVAKQLIAAEKVEDFQALYKTHPGDLCLFVVGGQTADFVFLPK